MSKYNQWVVVNNEQPSPSKWNILGTNDSYFEDVANTGWVEADETWSYASADSPSFTFTISGDKTTKYQPGMRIRLKQGGAYKYFIITAVSYSSPNTTVTIYGGTDYTLTNFAITLNDFANVKAPFGFSLDPAKWSVESTDTSIRTQATPVDLTWYNPGSLSITIPIGIWNVYFTACLKLNKVTTNLYDTAVALSTSTSSVSNDGLKGAVGMAGASADLSINATIVKNHPVTLAVKTVHYLIVMNTGASLTNLSIDGRTTDGAGASKTIMRAVCAYL